MSEDIYRFDEWAGSGRGLEARPIMPNDIVALLSHIQSITYEVNDILIPGTIVSGSLDPDDVMFEEAQAWDKDDEGYTFLWNAPGTLWPTAGKKYRIVVAFVQTALQGGNTFLRVWEVTTKNPKTRN